MSRPSFRPRPIDHAKPLPIIKSSKDLRNEDDVVVNRALPAIATGVDPAEEEERHLKQALLASVFGDTSSAAADIPIPVVSKVEPPKIPSKEPFKRPETEYIVFDRSDEDLEHTCIDYDADFEDVAFLEKFNTAHPVSDKAKASALTINILECALDALEKAQGRSENQDSLISYGNARPALSEAMPSFMDTARREVYQHWFQRRTAHPTPFLRFYQKQPDPGDQNPAVAFRPRDKDASASAGRRMNTFENFRRATTLRSELESLRKILKTTVVRDTVKLELMSVQAMRARLSMLLEGGQRMEMINKQTLQPRRDMVLMHGEHPTQIPVPCTGLKLPSSIPVAELPGDLLDKTKKSRKKAVIARAGSEKGRVAGESADPSRSIDKGRDSRAFGMHAGLDTFGFDEHGNRFLKQMRYFAGGFMNYGVGPYDHRVFAAASERNTVRELPRKPHPVMLPSSAVPFAKLSKSEESFATLLRLLKQRRGGKLGFHVREPSKEKGLSLRISRGIPTRKERRPVRVRGRVGRGGRILFDRVPYEPERGVKAASYPCSVEMGGVYTAGIPFEAASRVMKTNKKGWLGEVAMLQPKVEADDNEDQERDPSSENEELFSALVDPLQPMAHLSKGVMATSGEVDYWPHRKTGDKTRSMLSPTGIIPSSPSRGSELFEKGVCGLQPGAESLRTLPAFAPIKEDLVVEVDAKSSSSDS